MLWRSESTDALFEHEGTGVHVLFTGRITLKGALGEVTEISAKGSLAPYSEQVKRAMAAGLLVHTARMRLTWGERVFELSLDAEHLDVKGAKLPELMTEEEDDRDQERLQLSDLLGRPGGRLHPVLPRRAGDQGLEEEDGAGDARLDGRGGIVWAR